MPENPHDHKDLRPPDEKKCARKKPADDNGDSETAGEKRSYYYDDAHGYEIYDPDEDEREEA